MMRNLNLIGLCLTLVALLSFGWGQVESSDGRGRNYSGYKLISVLPTHQEDLTLLNEFKNDEKFDVWNVIHGVNNSVHVLLSDQKFSEYSRVFKATNMTFDILSNNVQELIDAERTSSSEISGRRLSKNSRSSSVLTTFSSYGAIMNWIIEMQRANPSLASVRYIGSTYENRRIGMITLKTLTSSKGLFIDCGIHAREWISPSTCVQMINKFITDYNSGDPITRSLLSKYEINIVPVVNPDGYEYSRNSDRMWRKNRKPAQSNRWSWWIRGGCPGVDLNRNWGYQWRTGGSSRNQCSETYAGPQANSENEVRAIQNFIQSKPRGFFESYLTFHSYGQYWFRPWGYSKSAYFPDQRDLDAKAQIGLSAIQQVHGRRFTYGAGAQVIYVASGGTEDWTYGVAGIKYSYCLELRPDNNSNGNGFLIQESEIPLAGEETYRGVKALFNAISISY